jgi:hypothetical protein
MTKRTILSLLLFALCAGTSFPMAADAEKAGYVRYTSVDDTGAISYANCNWESADALHPSQLWYDRKGRLLGADYSVPRGASASPPQRRGINPGRWAALDGHVHWVAKDSAMGALSYDRWMPDAKFSAAGGDAEHPSPKTLVAAHRVANAGDVVRIFQRFSYAASWSRCSRLRCLLSNGTGSTISIFNSVRGTCTSRACCIH